MSGTVIMIPCPDCDGAGELICGGCSGSGEGFSEGSTCRLCHGGGAMPCETCNGDGEVAAVCVECGEDADTLDAEEPICRRCAQNRNPPDDPTRDDHSKVKGTEETPATA